MSDTEAVKSLTELGLREYEARCFVALTRLSEGTAKEISRVADVPQSRVYDVVDQLHRRGLVSIQESEPRTYAAVPVDTARKRLRAEYEEQLEAVATHLQNLERRTTDRDGVWQVGNQQDIRLQATSYIDDAEREIYLLVGASELLETALLEALATALDKGVTVYLEVPSAAGCRRVRDAVASANVAVTDFEFGRDTVDSSAPPPALGRLLLVDRETVLLSARTEGLIPNETVETGLWGRESAHGLVGWLRYVLESRLERLEFDACCVSNADAKQECEE